MLIKTRKSAVCLLAAVALAFAGGGGGTLTYAALPSENGITNTVPKSIVDKNLNGNIHLTKLDDGAGAGIPATGTQLDKNPDGAKPVEGIKFTLYKVGKDNNDQLINLTTNAGLRAAAALQAVDINANLKKYDAKKISEQTTNREGKIDWTGLDLGVYLLVETDSTAKDGKTYKAAAPSLIFLPTTNPKDQSSWIMDGKNYGVWVYPKNSQEVNIKTVKDENKHAGNTITYQLSTRIPAVTKYTEKTNPPLGDPSLKGLKYNLKSVAFSDDLNKNLELKDTSSVKVYYGSDANDMSKNHQLESSDYKATIEQDNESVTLEGSSVQVQSGQKLFVALKVTGLNKVAEHKEKNPNTSVFVQFSPKVLKAAVVPNQAIVYNHVGKGTPIIDPVNPTPPTPPETPPGNPPVPPTPPGENPPVPGIGQKTNVVVSAWGKIQIEKKDEANNPLPKGATFEIYGLKNSQTVEDKEQWAKQKITVNGKSTWTTGNDGKVLVDGLHANNLEDYLTTVDSYTSYLLVETKAPDGYELIQQPIQFKVNVEELEKVIKKTTWETDEKGEVISKTIKTEVETQTTDNVANSLTTPTLAVHADVVNIPVKPKLPLTGGIGVVLFGLLGLAIVSGGIYVARRNSRKANA